MPKRFILALVLSLFAGAVSADFKSASDYEKPWKDFEREFEADKPWVEIAAQLPPYPKDENLLPFFVSSANSNRHFVDGASISIGEDGVVHYSVVIKASGGAVNVSFEGMRCGTRERKLYAFGRPDGTWARARDSAWRGVPARSVMAYARALYDESFCPEGVRVRNVEEAVDHLRRGTTEKY